ncbi:MAG: hypothetical protein ACR2LS_06875, partial [Thermomicrobiales bacterium]
VYTGVELVVTESFDGGVQNLGLAEGGVGLADPVGNAEDEYLAVAALYAGAIIAAEFTVPSTEEELETFEPVATPEGTPGASPAASPQASPMATPGT